MLEFAPTPRFKNFCTDSNLQLLHTTTPTVPIRPAAIHLQGLILSESPTCRVYLFPPLYHPKCCEEKMAKRERPNAEIVVAEDDKQIQQCINIRIEVFHHEQKFPLDTEIDEYDEPGRAVHFLLRSVPDHQPMGTLRMIQKPQEYKLGRLCLLKEYRGLRFGEDLLRRSSLGTSRLNLISFDECSRCLEMGTQNAHSWAIVQAERIGRPAEISLHSQIYAKAFYSREGYVEEGPEFDEDGAPHQRMVWRAPKTKGADTSKPIESN
ncbi:hypothetical protein OPQ81_004551 [Rhizoctonia solani]|nr:hypothetical protein OPQ81_004551 [Rhizoctonia solani]